MKITKTIDITWYGWSYAFMYPFITWGTWYPEFKINSFKYFILGPIEFRKWKTLQDLDKSFWNDDNI